MEDESLGVTPIGQQLRLDLFGTAHYVASPRMAQSGPLGLRGRLSSSLLGKGFDGHEAQPVAGGLVAVDDPTECKVAYLVVVGRPAGETVAHLIDKFLERRFAQSL
jgi:hypothetical protein